MFKKKILKDQGKILIFMTKLKVHKRSSDCKRTVLAADLEDLIIRDQEMSIFSTDISKMVSEDLK
jgi:hypothetical protein